MHPATLLALITVVSRHENSTSASTKNKTVTNAMNPSTNIIICRDAKSPYYLAQFTAPNGTRMRRSTKVPVAGGIFRGEKLTRAQAQKRALLVAFDIARATEQEYSANDNRTMRELCQIMLGGKLGRVSTATYRNARTDYNRFLAWLGKRADAPARTITKADIRTWVADTRKEIRCASTRKALCAVRSAFRWAVDSEIIPKNPCDGVKVPPDTKDEKIIHEAFTRADVAILLAKLPEEWAAAVRCCIGTYGQRLGDIRSLTWAQFNWQERTVHIVTQKTAEDLHQPMSPDFYAWARTRYEQALAAGGEPAQYVLPALHSHTNPSQEFTKLVRLHGIGLSGGGGLGKRRTWHSKTFHSLRAYIATELASAGVSLTMAMHLMGHESEDAHAVYIRPTMDQLRTAAAMIAS